MSHTTAVLFDLPEFQSISVCMHLNIHLLLQTTIRLSLMRSLGAFPIGNSSWCALNVTISAAVVSASVCSRPATGSAPAPHGPTPLAVYFGGSPWTHSSGLSGAIKVCACSVSGGVAVCVSLSACCDLEPS